jgi:hypothetical protein
VATPRGTLRDMSRPRRKPIEIVTTKESSAVIRKVTKPAKAGRTLNNLNLNWFQKFRGPDRWRRA